MFLKNIAIAYPVLLITSIQKSFEALGKTVGKTGKTIARWLLAAQLYHDRILILLRYQFRDAKFLYLIVDETLIKKIYSQLMEGSGFFYDTKIMRRITAYKLLAAMLSDGRQAIPFESTFLFSKELLPSPKESKYDWIKRIIHAVELLFPHARIIVVGDGAFANKAFLRWHWENKKWAEMRIRSNCVVEYQGQRIAIRDIKRLRPKGRQMARTISVLWHGIPLFITAERRFDKRGKESVVYQASTFEAKPIEHVRIYKIRWHIEMFFRTAKQKLGLEKCASRKLEKQRSHVASVFLAYALVQCDRKERGFKTPEEAIRAAELKNGNFLQRYFDRLNRFFKATGT